MAQPVCPSLNSGTKQVITSRSGIASYIIYYFFTNPGNISETFPGMISFREVEAKYELEPSELTSAVESYIKDALDRYFYEDKISVDVTREQIDQKTYRFILSLTSSSGEPIIDGKTVKVNQDSIEVLP